MLPIMKLTKKLCFLLFFKSIYLLKSSLSIGLSTMHPLPARLIFAISFYPIKDIDLFSKDLSHLYTSTYTLLSTWISKPIFTISLNAIISNIF